MEFTYNTEGLVGETITDAQNRTTTYLYDDMGRTAQVIRPDTTSL